LAAARKMTRGNSCGLEKDTPGLSVVMIYRALEAELELDPAATGHWWNLRNRHNSGASTSRRDKVIRSLR
jgi:hypothetical protein